MEKLTPEKIGQVTAKTDKILKEAQQKKCTWNDCPIKVTRGLGLPLLKMENNQVQEVEGKKVNVPFCMYHALICSTGLFGALQGEKENTFTFVGPIDEVNTAEVTINAMIMTGRIQELINHKNKIEQEIKDAMEAAKTRPLTDIPHTEEELFKKENDTDPEKPDQETDKQPHTSG